MIERYSTNSIKEKKKKTDGKTDSKSKLGKRVQKDITTKKSNMRDKVKNCFNVFFANKTKQLLAD